MRGSAPNDMAKLRVFGGNLDGIHRAIVAAPNKTQAAKAIGISLHHFNGYFSETGNPEEVEQAMSEPGVAWRKEYRQGKPWERLRKSH